MERAFLTKEQLSDIKDMYEIYKQAIVNQMYAFMLDNCTETREIDDLLEINDVEEFENIDEEIMSLVWFKLTRYGTKEMLEFEEDCMKMQERQIKWCHDDRLEAAENDE